MQTLARSWSTGPIANSNSRPVRVSGAVNYSGIETGAIYVLTVTSSSSWSIAQSVALSGPGPYTNDLGMSSYWFKAFRDANSSYTRRVGAIGIYSGNTLSQMPRGSISLCGI